LQYLGLIGTHAHRESAYDQALKCLWQQAAELSDIVIRASDENSADVSIFKKFDGKFRRILHIAFDHFVNVPGYSGSCAAAAHHCGSSAAFDLFDCLAKHPLLLLQRAKVEGKRPGTLFIHQDNPITSVGI
jgi:hypothetical protein